MTMDQGFKELAVTVREIVDEKFAPLQRRIDEMEAMQNRPGFARSGGFATKSLSEQLFEHPEFEDFRKRGARGRLRLVLKAPPELETKTTITSAAVGSATSGVLVPQRVPGIVKPGVPRIRVRDLIPRFDTLNNAVDFVKENVFTNLASPQTEGSAKQESALTFETDTESIRTVAHWIPATRQVVDDLPQLRLYIDQRLIDGLMDEEDDQILRGDDTGLNLKGLSSSATAYADATYDQAGDLALDKLLRMMTQIEDSNLNPTGFILHPRDWRIIQSQKADYGGGAGTGPYVMGGPQSLVPNMCWGLPVATTTRMTAGQAFCGAFLTHTALAVRQDVIVELSTEHANFFTENKIAIRAEERIALLTYRADAIVWESSL